MINHVTIYCARCGGWVQPHLHPEDQEQHRQAQQNEES